MSIANVISLETQREIMQALTPQQLAVVALKVDGCKGAEIAELLGITRQAVRCRLNGARERVLRRFPELTYWDDESRKRGLGEGNRRLTKSSQENA